MDITIMNFSTLEAIKRDAMGLLALPGLPVAVATEARLNVQAVNRELDRRIEWAKAAQVAAAELDRVQRACNGHRPGEACK